MSCSLRFVQAMGSTELGSSVHAALASWHVAGGDLLAIYAGPEGWPRDPRPLPRASAGPSEDAGRRGWVQHEDRHDARVRGLVDRVLRSSTAGPSSSTTRPTRLSTRTLIEAYSVQLRLYGLAARRGLVPGGAHARLLLFDLRRGQVIEVTPDDNGVEARVVAAAALIAAGDFGPPPEEHAAASVHDLRVPADLPRRPPTSPDFRRETPPAVLCFRPQTVVLTGVRCESTGG